MSVPVHFDLTEIEAQARAMAERSAKAARKGAPNGLSRQLVELQIGLTEVVTLTQVWQARAHNEGRDPDLVLTALVSTIAQMVTTVVINCTDGSESSSALAVEICMDAMQHTVNILQGQTTGCVGERASVRGTTGGHA